MELFATQAIAVGVERRSIPKSLERGPRFVAECGLVALDRFHDEAYPRAVRQRGWLIRLEHTVLECCSDYLDHFFCRLRDGSPLIILDGTDCGESCSLRRHPVFPESVTVFASTRDI